MKKILIAISCFSFSFFISKGQTLKKYSIANTGCAVYMYCNPERFDEDFSEDSSKVYTAECEKDEVTYGIICVKLLQPADDLKTAEELMISYLEYLKVNYEIKSAAGYGKGLFLNNREDTRGVVDYWEDSDKNNWKIKAWTDKQFIAFLYAKSKKELPVEKVDVYLNSFRLPGI